VEGKTFPEVKKLSSSEKLRILITGGAGFVGSHLVDRLMMQGHQVTVLDNLFTGRKQNIGHWEGHPNFNMVMHDVVEPFMVYNKLIRLNYKVFYT
jgi:UDP-glucuronate decarboxylase